MAGERTLRVRIDGNASGAERAMSSLGGAVKGFAAIAAASFGVDAIVGFAKGSITAASDLNETLNKSNVIFGKNAGEIEKWASTASTSFGLSKGAALEAAASYGNMFQQIGFSGDKATEMSKTTVQLAADLGSFNNLETADVMDRLQAAFRGEFDSLQAVIPNINAARVEHEALAMTGKKTAKELTASEKAAATLAIVQKDGAAAAGDFAETSGGLANQQKILAARFEDIKARVGTALLPVMLKLVSTVSDKLGPAFDTIIRVGGQVWNAFKSLGDGSGTFATKMDAVFGGTGKAEGAFRTLGDVLRGVGAFITGTVIPAVTYLVTHIDDFAKAAYRNRDAIQTVATIIGVVLSPLLVALAVNWIAAKVQAVASAIAQARAWVMAQVAAVRSALQQAWAHTTTVAGWIRTAAVATANAARQVGAWVLTGAQAFASALRQMGAFAMTAAGWVAAGIRATASAAIVVAGWVLMGVQSMIQAARMAAAWLIAMGPVGWVIAAVIGLVALIVANWSKVKAFTIAAWNAVVGGVKAAVNWMLNFFMNWTLPGLIFKHLDTIKRFFVNAWNAVKNAVSTAINSVVGFIGGIWGRISGFISSLASKVWSGVTGAWSRVTGWLGGIGGRILGAIGNVGSTLMSVGRNLITGLWNGITGAAGWLKSKLVGFFKNLVPGWAKDALGIKSPSRVFMGIGGYTGQGFGAGFVNSMGAVKKDVIGTVSGLSSAAADAALTSLPAMSVALDGPERTGALRGSEGASRGSLAAAPSMAGANITINANTNANPQDIGNELLWLMKTGQV